MHSFVLLNSMSKALIVKVVDVRRAEDINSLCFYATFPPFGWSVFRPHSVVSYSSYPRALRMNAVFPTPVSPMTIKAELTGLKVLWQAALILYVSIGWMILMIVSISPEEAKFGYLYCLKKSATGSIHRFSFFNSSSSFFTSNSKRLSLRKVNSKMNSQIKRSWILP